MEIIYVILIFGYLLTLRIAYSVGKGVGRTKFINKINLQLVYHMNLNSRCYFESNLKLNDNSN